MTPERFEKTFGSNIRGTFLLPADLFAVKLSYFRDHYYANGMPIATGWTECVLVVMRSGELVIEALSPETQLFPFPLRGVDFDNDGAVMNEPVVDWCRALGLEITRSRASTRTTRLGSNRRTGRSCGASSATAGRGTAAKALARLYAAARLHTNLFQPGQN